MVITCFLRSWCRANLDDKRTLKCNPTKHQLTFQNFFILGLTSGKNSQYDNHMCWAFSEPTKFAEVSWNSDWLEWRQRNSRFLLNCFSHPNYRPAKKNLLGTFCSWKNIPCIEQFHVLICVDELLHFEETQRTRGIRFPKMSRWMRFSR